MTIRSTISTNKQAPQSTMPARGLKPQRRSTLSEQVDRPNGSQVHTPASTSATAGPPHSFGRVSVHSPQAAAAGKEGTASCPVFPRTCPFGGACHTCPVGVQAN